MVLRVWTGGFFLATAWWKLVEDDFTVGQKTIQVVALWGRTVAVPDVVKMAVVIQVIRWLERGRQMFTDTGAFPEMGQMTFTQELDPGIRTILKNSRLMRNPMG